MKERTVHIKRADNDQYWIYQQRSSGNLTDDPLHVVLTWILEQINFNNIEYCPDENGDITTLKIGEGAGLEFESVQRAKKHAKDRLQILGLVGIFARSREEGTKPERVELDRYITATIDDGGRRNTEVYYAFQLVKILKRISSKTFKFDSPPILGIAPQSVVGYLREASRCWLYGLYNACVALCRACLEASIKARLSEDRNSKWGVAHADAAQSDGLKELIDRVERFGYLDGPGAYQANLVRKCANDALHGDSVTADRCREALDAMRSVVEHLFSEEAKR